MKKTYLIILLFSFLAHSAFSQEERSDKVQALKIAFITERLQLTSTEAQKFWPVYNSYENEISRLWSSYHKKGNSNVLDNEERLLAVKKKYRNSFETILGKDKANSFFQAEQDFRGVLLNSLKKRNTPHSGKAPQRR